MANPALPHDGSCHCKAVKFRVTLDATHGTRCNCTICIRTAATSAQCKPAAFEVLQGQENLSMYEWGGKTGQRYFCKTCGIQVFGRGSGEWSGGEYVSVNLNCLDDIDPREITVGYFDGRNDNWMAGLRPEPWPLRKAAA